MKTFNPLVQLAFVFILVSPHLEVGAQSRTELVMMSDDPYIVEKIKFKNEDGDVVSTFDIEANNPFAQQLQAANASSNPTQSKKVKDLVSNSDQYLDPTTKDLPVDHAFTTYSLIKNESREIKGVAYSINVQNIANEVIGSESIIELIDSNGKVRKSFKLKTDYQSMVISNDEKFLGFTYGGAVDHNGFELFEQGFSLVEINTNKEVYGVKNINENLSALSSEKGLFVFEGYTYSSYHFYIIDILNRAAFNKAFTQKVRFTLKEITKSGLIFSTNGKSYTIEYTSNFNQEKF